MEIITHAGPHRRLWMGPQFSFKTFQTQQTTVLASNSSILLSQSPEAQVSTMDIVSDDLDLQSLKSVSYALLLIYLDRDMDDINLDRDPEDAPVYTRHSLFNRSKHVTFVFIVQSLFDSPDIAIHLISGLELSRSGF